MQKASKIETTGERIGTIISEINISINREFTQNEKYAISEYNRDIINLLSKNSYNSHPDTKLEVVESSTKLLECFSEKQALHVEEIPNEYWRVLFCTFAIGTISVFIPFFLNQ